MAGSKYKVFFDNGKNILLHENIIIKYNLLITKKIEEDYYITMMKIYGNRFGCRCRNLKSDDLADEKK